MPSLIMSEEYGCLPFCYLSGACSETYEVVTYSYSDIRSVRIAVTCLYSDAEWCFLLHLFRLYDGVRYRVRYRLCHREHTYAVERRLITAYLGLVQAVFVELVLFKQYGVSDYQRVRNQHAYRTWIVNEYRISDV